MNQQDEASERAARGWLHVDALDQDGKGVARRADGKVIFIEGALPGEWVSAQSYRKKKDWEAAALQEVHVPSSQRTEPACPYFGLHQGACGGCKLQHLDVSGQVAIKQRALEDQLWHLGKVRAERVLPSISGPDWGYRHRARLSVRFVDKKGEVLVGFRERKSRYIADMRSCAILPPPVSALLVPLRRLVESLDVCRACPQIELACGDKRTALVLRHLEPLTAADLARLSHFAAAHGVDWWLQEAGPDSVRKLDPGTPDLCYSLPEFGIEFQFRPTDFTQINPHINQVLVARAVRWLKLDGGERVIDWFCGLGNFSLPIATQAGSVLGIEGSAELVGRARLNHERNAFRRRLASCDFAVRNLFEMTPQQLVRDRSAQRWLIDPPREGALALVKALAALQQGQSGPENWQPPARIVYVSCNPATLARDAGLLVHQAGYHCRAAGVINMFPHTAHVESMAVFDLL